MNQNTARMLLRYVNRTAGERGAKERPEATQQFYRWAKKWWTGLSARMRGEVRRRLMAGRPPLARHLVGAPHAGGLLKMTGIADSPAPRSRAPYRAAAKVRAAKRVTRRRRSIRADIPVNVGKE